MGLYAKKIGDKNKKYMRINESNCRIGFDGIYIGLRGYPSKEERVKEKKYIVEIETFNNNVQEKISNNLTEIDVVFNETLHGQTLTIYNNEEEKSDVLIDKEDPFAFYASGFIDYSRDVIPLTLVELYDKNINECNMLNSILNISNDNYTLNELDADNPLEHTAMVRNIVNNLYSSNKQLLDDLGFSTEWVLNPVLISEDGVFKSNTNCEAISLFNKINLYGDVVEGDSFLLNMYEDIESDE